MLTFISESELMLLPGYMIGSNETHKEDFEKILYNLGMDIHKGYELQVGFTHRNRLNKVVNCNRWCGMERLDDEWINSGYASREAKHLASGSGLIRDVIGADKMKEELVAISRPEDFADPKQEDNE